MVRKALMSDRVGASVWVQEKHVNETASKNNKEKKSRTA